MLVVRDGTVRTGNSEVIFGYDMNLRAPRTFEQESRGNPLSGQEMRFVTAALVEAVRGDNNILGVTQGRITTVSPQYVRRAMARG